MKNIELIAIDLDGTLLDSSGVIPEENISVLQQAAEQGLAVTICTGRMFDSARKFAVQLGVKAPIVCYNGAMVSELDGHIISHTPLEMEQALKLLDYFRKRGSYVQSYVDDELLIKNDSSPIYKAYHDHYRITARTVGDELYSPATPPTKIISVSETPEEASEVLGELRDIFGEQLYLTRSTPTFVEMMNRNVNKFLGISTVAAALGIANDRIMALGDGDNDEEMLAQVGFGVAMENAGAKAKAAADCIAPSNDEFGVAWAVKKFAL